MIGPAFWCFLPRTFSGTHISNYSRVQSLSVMKQPVLCPALLLLFAPILTGGTLTGHVRDENWYAQYQSNPPGVGYYEFAVNANATNNPGLGGFAATDVFGAFSMPNLPGSLYTV